VRAGSQERLQGVAGGGPQARPVRGGSRRRGALALLLLAAAALSGCGGQQSILRSDSHQTHVISVLWWWMLAAAGVVFAGAVVLLVLAYVRRGRAGLPFVGERESLAGAMVIVFGIAVPLIVLLVLFGASDIYAVRFSEAPPAGSTSMSVEVKGHQWWWEIHYPGTAAVSANEIHIPTGTRVRLYATTADVIHSLWVPSLARKIDMIPGRTNAILLEAPSPGSYLGQCSEFCGLQHSYMRFTVIAEPRASFEAWLADMERPAAAPASGEQREGQQLFMSKGCGGCHRLAGTSAEGTVGPDLTHLATRSTLAALTIPDTPSELAAWIENPQAIKPGNHMPDLGLSGAQAKKVAAFLGEMR
jgi:cytochrome c oxidase subunit 2